MRDNSPLWVIPASLALLIPIIAVLSEAPTALSVLVGATLLTGAAVGGGWFLMQERHKLRMREIEAEAAAQRAASDQLEKAERLLDRDDGVAELRREISEPPEIAR
jgi:hypothetical protein